VPQYDASVPKPLLRRYITNALVWLYTLSLKVRDSMCGFRVYPLARAVGSTTQRPSSAHAVRHRHHRALALVRVSVVNLKTPVTYPVDGVSHFDLLRDNLRMAGLHLRLAPGFVLRLPSCSRAAWRRRLPHAVMPNAAEHQVHRSRLGVAAGGRSVGRLWFLYGVYRCGAVALSDHAVAVAFYFTLSRGVVRRASLEYLERVGLLAPDASWQTLVHVVRHIERFADALLDKALAWTGALDVGATQMNVDPRFDAAVEAARRRYWWWRIAATGSAGALALRLPRSPENPVHTRQRNASTAAHEAEPQSATNCCR